MKLGALEFESITSNMKTRFFLENIVNAMYWYVSLRIKKTYTHINAQFD